MNLIHYTEDEQKGLVNFWYDYYGKGLRTVEDYEDFYELVERRLDDILALIALEHFNLHQFFEGFPENYSFCNMIYVLNAESRDEKNNKVDEFLNLIKDAFNNAKLYASHEKVVDDILGIIKEEYDLSRNLNKNLS